MIEKILYFDMVFIAARVVYWFMFIVFIFGLWAGGIFGAFYLAFVITPIVTLIAAVIVVIVERSFLALIGFFAISIGTWIVPAIIIVSSIHQDRVRTNEWATFVYERTAIIENSIGPIIREFYPHAEFNVGRISTSQNITRVRLGGFSWEQQPDFDYEIEKWRGIMEIWAMRLYPYRIAVEYFFEGTPSRFAWFDVHRNFPNEFNLHFDHRGMSEEGFEIVKSQLERYLSSYNEEFRFDISWSRLTVSIYTKPYEPFEEDVQTTRWYDFLQANNINAEIANITVVYNIPATTEFGGGVRVIHLDRFHWLG